MPTTVTVECRVCGEAIEGSDEILECPFCGAIQEFTPRRRSDGNRPRREILVEVRSENFNGVYKIHKNSDGTLSCSCPSFMKGNGGPAGALSYACKHIRQAAQSDGPLQTNGAPPSEWQEAALRKLGVSDPERLSNVQAYYLVNDILAYQGVTYREYERILREHGKVSVLPILPVGVEFEGYVSADVGYDGLSERFNAAGLPSIVPGYTHNHLLDASGKPMYKLVADTSIRQVNGHEPIEIVSPKLFGVSGFNQIHDMLTLWREAGASVNASCGCHVHIDAYNYEDRHLLELMKLWVKIERPVLWLMVSPSRRNGYFSRAVTRDRILDAARLGASSVTRYLSLNVAAWGRYKTVEFRLHQGTTTGKKIIPWIVFLMKLVEAVKNGLTHRDVEPALESVFGAVGMDETATSRIRRAGEYLARRSDWWKRDIEEYPSHMPQVNEIDLEAVEREIETIVSNRREPLNGGRRSVRPVTPMGEEILRRRHGTTSTIRVLTQSRAAVYYTPEVTDPDAREYNMRAVRGNGGTYYTVTRQGAHVLSEDDTLNCTCRGFQRRWECSHTINLARALMSVITEREQGASLAVAAGR